MKKWEEQQKHKNHQQKIQKAKSKVQTGKNMNSSNQRIDMGLNDSKTQVWKSPSDFNSRKIESGSSHRTGISDYYTHEKEDLNQIPLYRLLKMYNLQQYSQKLISRGFGYDLVKFNYLSKVEREHLLHEIKCLPGHKYKLLKLLDYIQEVMPSLNEDEINLSPPKYTQSPHAQFSTGLRQKQQQQNIQQTIYSTGNNQSINYCPPLTTSSTGSQQQNRQRQQMSSSQHTNNSSQKSIHNQSSSNSKLPDVRNNSRGKNLVSPYSETQYANVPQKNKLSTNSNFQNHGLPKNSNSNSRKAQSTNSMNYQKPKNFYIQQIQQNKQQQKQQQQQQQQQQYSSLQDIQHHTLNQNQKIQTKKIEEIGGDFFIEEKNYNQFQEITENLGEAVKQYENQSKQHQIKENIQQNSTKNQLNNQNMHQQMQNSINKISFEEEINNKQQNNKRHSNNSKNQNSSSQSSRSQLSSHSTAAQDNKQQINNGNQVQKKLATKTINNNINQQQQQVQNKNIKKQSLGQKQIQQQQQKGILKNQQKSKDDIQIIHKLDSQNQLQVEMSKNKILKNLEKNLVEKESSSKDILNAQLEYEKIKQMYMSYDSGKLTSTIINLDIEELCYCLACAINKHIQFSDNNQYTINQDMYISYMKKQTDFQENQQKKKNLETIKETTQTPVKKQEKIQNKIDKEELNSYEKDLSADESLTQSQKDRLLDSSSNSDLLAPTKDNNEKSEKQDLKKQEKNSDNDGEDSDEDDYYDDSDFKYDDIIAKGKKQAELNKQKDKSLYDISERNEASEIIGQTLINESKQENFGKEVFEQSRNEIEDILKESLLINQKEKLKQSQNNLNNQVNENQLNQEDNISETMSGEEDDENIDNQIYGKQNLSGLCENVSKYQGSQQDYQLSQQNMSEIQKNTDKLRQSKNPMEFSYESRYAIIEMSIQDQNDLLNNFTLFNNIFGEKTDDQLVISNPSKVLISDFCKNILITSKMEKEVPIIALVYIERLLIKSQIGMTGKNWRRIAFTALILASKIWDDESFESDNFAKAFSTYTTIEINEMERIFLQFIEYKLYVSSYDYAKYYFILRSFKDKTKKSFPLRPLDLKTILYLQNQTKIVEQKFQKEHFMQSLNKSF